MINKYSQKMPYIGTGVGDGEWPKKWKQPGQPVSLLCCVETPDGPSFKVRVPCKVREDRSGAWPTASARC